MKEDINLRLKLILMLSYNVGIFYLLYRDISFLFPMLFINTTIIMVLTYHYHYYNQKVYEVIDDMKKTYKEQVQIILGTGENKDEKK